MVKDNQSTSNISERKRIRDAIQESESRYRELFNNISSGVAIYEVTNNGEDFIFKDFNKAGERLDGDRKEDLIGKSVLQVRPGIKEFGLLDVFKRVYNTGIPEHFPAKIYSDSKLTKWFENYVYKLDTGEIVAVYDDVTEHKAAEESLLNAHERLRHFVDANIVGIVVASPSGRIIETNDYYLDIISYTRDEFEQGIIDWRAITPPECLPVDEYSLKELFEQGRATPYEKEYVRRDGTRVSVFICNVLLTDTEIAAFVLDITDRKRIEEELKRYTKELEDANTALRVFINRRERDQKTLEDKLLLNIEELVMPYLKKLNGTCLDSRQINYLEVLENNLKNIVSPYMVNLTATYKNLTPQEIQIANLIRQGKNTKQIAELLCTSAHTVGTHRNNIRKKLKLRNSKSNLRSYLLSLI